jgi:phage major head subunit gpT-like protein
MIITPASINALFTGFETKWWQAYQASEIFWDSIASLSPSTTDRETHAWPARIPVMREWLGERVSNNMAPYVTTIVNKDFELTEVIKRNTIEDDQYDVFASPLLAMMGEAAKKNPDYLLVDALKNGNSTTIWGQPEFLRCQSPRRHARHVAGRAVELLHGEGAQPGQLPSRPHGDAFVQG